MAKEKTVVQKDTVQSNANGQPKEDHLSVLKTYKLYIGGKFPRTESGRFIPLKDSKGKLVANICRGSRKDFRNSVVAARAAFGSWSSRAAFNRAQILYRIAEMLEGRKVQFISELEATGSSPAEAKKEVEASIDRLVYYAGWADKYQQIFSSVNPVSSSHFNFSLLEPTGVISVFCPENSGLLGLISATIPLVCGGNTVVALSSGPQAQIAISFAEVLNSSDVPGGVFNFLTGLRDELLSHFSTHMDVNAMAFWGQSKEDIETVRKNAVVNVKRTLIYQQKEYYGEDSANPYLILDGQETKTTWHPVGI